MWSSVICSRSAWDLQLRYIEYSLAAELPDWLWSLAWPRMNPNISVLILEAGPNNLENPRITTPVLAFTSKNKDDFDWQFMTIPQVCHTAVMLITSTPPTSSSNIEMGAQSQSFVERVREASQPSILICWLFFLYLALIIGETWETPAGISRQCYHVIEKFTHIHQHRRKCVIF